MFGLYLQKSLGVVVLLFSILVLLIFPIFFNYKNIFSNKPVTAVTYTEKFPPKGSHTFYSFLFWCFVVICVFLGILGGKPMDFPIWYSVDYLLLHILVILL